jgi:hypothetical protein
MIIDKVSEIQTWAEGADSIAWDECHKIYILMDSTQTQLMHDYGYPVIHTKEMPFDFVETILGWYEDSCSLRFVDAIETDADGNSFWHTVVAQFEGDEE